MSEEVDSLLSMFKGAPGDAQRAARQVRAKKERRTQMTPKQRRRGGIRTTQINYRCSEAYKALMHKLAEAMDGSIADAAEEAAARLAEALGLGVEGE